MADALTPIGLLADAAIAVIVEQANAALGLEVLSFSDGKGISLAVQMPEAPLVALDNLTTAGGIGGRLHIDDIPPEGLSASLFGDFTVALTAFDLTLSQGAFVSTNIAGRLTVPYFTNAAEEHQTVDVEVAVRADGSLAVTLAAQQSDPAKMTPDGLVKLHYDLPAETSIDLEIATLEVERESDGVWRLTLTGSIALDTVGIDWPEVELRGLSIDSKGNVTLKGGWIDLPSQAAIDYFGFHVALQRLGFGADSSGRWIGFDGDVNLVEGVPLGGSVRGLKVNIDTGAVSFSGVSVDFEIPDVLSFSGEIDHLHLGAGEDPSTIGLPANIETPLDLFAGGVDVTIQAAGDLEVDAQFIVGTFKGQSAFFLALDAELPVGIPLFADVALYGLSGMFASNLSPNIGSASWWDWFKYPTVASGPAAGTPDLTGAPDLQGGTGEADYTATDAMKWLNPVPGAFALGAGAVIGTQDDGFTASASISFILILPGPVMMLIGKANILSKRIGGPAESANFEAMATYDGNADTFDMVIEAHYSIPVVLDVQATGELYADPGEGVWYLAIGKPPHEQRVSARVLDLFETDLYFLVSDSGLVAGIWTGYRNSWSFGPLSASIDAYLAATAAIQWSPLQLAAGVELHGEVHLEAFGIGLGITADALIEATAPDPWWVYGSLSVELELPWPLPNVGGSVSLSWGENGPPPPAPLALSTVSATLIDHGATDRYELLAHRAGVSVNALSVADTVVYDPPAPALPGTPGILAAKPSGYWSSLYPGADLATDASSVVPDLAPETLARAPLVPQDSHFALSFAHPVADLAGFAGSTPPPSELVEVLPPSSSTIGPDDMSKIDARPPVVQWCIHHSLVQVALYRYDDSGETWQLLAATPMSAPSVSAPLGLAGAWVAPDPTKHIPVAGTVLKVAPYTVLEGEDFTVSWGGAPTTLGSSFTEQGLRFSTSPGASPVTIAAPTAGAPTGLMFKAESETSMTIAFPSAIVLTGLTGVIVQGGEFPYTAPVLTGDGQTLTPTSTAQDAGTSIYTLAFDPTAEPVSEIELPFSGGSLYLTSIAYRTPDIDMPILPLAPALYALKTVTRIEAGRVDGTNGIDYQSVLDGDPVIEFSYFQCASGPATATIGPPPLSGGFTNPLPYRRPPAPTLAEAADSPANCFPTGGRLNDLLTYTQWSWPGDGDVAAYYAYDLNVEFTETYVNALYATFLSNAEPYDYASSNLPPAVHLRCADRNQRQTLLLSLATHVPSAYPQSAIVAAASDVPLPATLAEPQPSSTGVAKGPVAHPVALPTAFARALSIPTGGEEESVSASSIAAAQATIDALPDTRLATGVDTLAMPALRAAIANAGLQLQPAAIGSGFAVNPGMHSAIAHELAELAAAVEARALWFAPLVPQTRYTVDVVAGPVRVRGNDRGSVAAAGTAGANSLATVFAASDAISALAALKRYLAEEDALTTLQRVQFTTSRYATFGDQLANVVAQTEGSAGTPVRRYSVPGGVDAQTWLLSASAEAARIGARGAYLTAREQLAAALGRFEALFDVNQSAALSDPGSGNGEQALATQRTATEAAWDAFASSTAQTFDGLVAELGQPGLVSSAKVQPPPDTELSLLTEDDDERIVALLLCSPEPLPWRRMWQWTTLEGVGTRARGLKDIEILWSTDRTRALIVPLGTPVGQYRLTLGFQGNIGAEVACITQQTVSVSETASCAPILVAPVPGREIPGTVAHPGAAFA